MKFITFSMNLSNILGIRYYILIKQEISLAFLFYMWYNEYNKRKGEINMDKKINHNGYYLVNNKRSILLSYYDL